MLTMPFKDCTVVGKKAFNLPIFEDMLSNAFFSKKNSFGFCIMPCFTSSDPENPEKKEIPVVMLALVSTAVCQIHPCSYCLASPHVLQIYAAIEDYQHALYNAGKFEVNSYLHVYKQNITVLDDIKTGNLQVYLQRRTISTSLAWLSANWTQIIVILSSLSLSLSL